MKATKNLVILESPNKCKAVQSYLGKNFHVVASKGHITEIVKKFQGFGFDLKTFTPKYQILKGKKKFINDLKKQIKSYDKIYLATDPDREGEAIAYHLFRELNLKNNYQRLRFNEITKRAIQESLTTNFKIDYPLFYSQEARTILDQIIGFKLSMLLQKNINSKSGGRVQSVALKFITDRYYERKNFVEAEYWDLKGSYQKKEINLIKIDLKNPKLVLTDEKKVINLQKKIKNKFEIIDIKTTTIFKKPPLPLTTSLILQKANLYFNFSVKRTTKVLQQLFEGIAINKNLIGLITYPRTDSQRLSKQFIKDCQDHILKNYGPKYLNKNLEFNFLKGRKTKIQDAHEAIRPTNLELKPLKIKKYLTSDQFKLYQLIYKITVASLMAEEEINNQIIDLKNLNCLFRIKNQQTIFLGFQKILQQEVNQDLFFTNLKIKQIIKIDTLNGYQKFSKPPAKYSSATLIKKLENSGIGRPSTYANIIFILENRNYIIKKDKKLNLTKKGLITNNFLQKFFPNIISENYTSKVETKLDLIAEDKIKKIDLLSKFSRKFFHRLEEVLTLITTKKILYKDQKCPWCQNNLIYKRAKNGDIPFVACDNFPKCKYLKPLIVLEKCSKCLKGQIVLRFSSYKNQYFFGCTNFKNCKNTFNFDYGKHNYLFKNNEYLNLNGLLIIDDLATKKNLKIINFF